MTELYCIFISGMILAMTAEAYLRVMCRHDWDDGRHGQYFKDEHGVTFYTSRHCRKCGQKKVQKFLFKL